MLKYLKKKAVSKGLTGSTFSETASKSVQKEKRKDTKWIKPNWRQKHELTEFSRKESGAKRIPYFTWTTRSYL